ncbi:helix-turn-helix domain-containing protein [Alkaliphilus sp. B6464]|uniref:helix-turn-helix domain-containing protein n=1 Tax=Alkaliphilus sp. B6464 TaxID=2731219 RepID=UPI001BAA22FB|nr:helix-turn-helix transcriptional regulator [Alkaliphilus sp. B6464]QUH18584.1 helix-turn-helix domain-containing protein [Alkaliphilus sp. B6464]
MLHETRKNITGLLIKSNREKLGLKQEYLCKGICSISYLSKIEKGNIVPSEDITRMLFKRLGVNFNNDIEFVRNGKRLFEEISKANYFGIPVDKDKLEEIRKNKSLYLNSPLNIDYQLFELYDTLFEVKSTDILEYKEYMDNDQLYKAYLITGYVNEDINLLEEAKKINYTAYVINQIGYIKWLDGKYYEAIELFLEALNLAYNEGCIRLQIDICMILGNIYMDFHIPTMQKYYDKALTLLEFVKNDRLNYLIYYHMGIAYLSTDFSKSEEFLLVALRLCPMEDIDSIEKTYQKLCFLYLRYNKREDANISYKKLMETNKLKAVNDLIGIMVSTKDYTHSEEYLEKLINIYNTSKKYNKFSNTKFYGDFLIDAYKANRRYKDALLVTEYLYSNIHK